MSGQGESRGVQVLEIQQHNREPTQQGQSSDRAEGNQ